MCFYNNKDISVFNIYTFFFIHTSIIEQLKITVQNQEAVIQQRRDQQTDAPSANCVKQLSDLVAKKDQELEV